MATGTASPINNVLANNRQAQASGSSHMLAIGNPALQIRVRATLAEINAGKTLVPAPGIGFALRFLDARVVPIGGAVTGLTTLDILGTVAAASVKLLAIAAAALTQSAVNRPGNTNNTVLADGGSFVQLDKNTPITLGKTGASAATATAVDIILDYAVDKL